MADTKVSGGRYLLWFDLAGGTDYDLVVCLTQVGSSTSVNTVDASTACGSDKSAGTVEISYSGEGQVLIDPSVGATSIAALKQACRNKTTLGFMYGPENPIAGDVVETGTGFLSQFDDTFPYDSNGTFSLTFQPYGTPTITIGS